MATTKRLFKATFYSGCIPEENVDTWARDKNAWVDGKFGTGLCDPGCQYQRFSKVKRLSERCPKGQVSVRLKIRGYCVCPDAGDGD